VSPRIGLSLAAAALSLALSGCGGGAAAPHAVTVQGTVTFDRVPAVAGRGLDYAQTVAAPARGVTVELVRAGTVLASTVTDASGAYAFAVAANTEVSLRVRAEMLRLGTPSFSFKVVDNLSDGALYALAGAPFDTGAAGVTRNLHAASGWTGSAYTAPRSAAPFAILDTVYDAVERVLAVAPGTRFPPLRLYWSPGNVPVAGGAPGEIGSSFFAPGDGIYLLGAADQDTDEYDRHVIAHEWGHYFEHAFARSDAISGPHAMSDQLDMRLAFGEGWGTFFAAMVNDAPVYVDSFGPRQSHAFSVDVEQTPTRVNPNPGWFNEESVQSLLYDLYDDGRDTPPGTTTTDDLALGFGPISAAMAELADAAPAASVFTFLDALKRARVADAPLIDALAASQRITGSADGYGSGETNFGVPATRDSRAVGADFHSVYDSLAVDGPAVNVCSLTDFTSPLSGAVNKLGSRRFVRFGVVAPGMYTITARAVAPLAAAADPDFVLHLRGRRVLESSSPSQCSAVTPGSCVESATARLAAGDYVLEVYEWTNTNDTADPDYPPIGRACFDVTVTQ
jgi:hypothetical protein